MSINTHTLKNGFRIVTETMPGLQSASVGVWVNAGGRHERLEQNGVAHFLEHMAFKGTNARSALDIAEVIEDVGGYINAYTSREMTAYYARVLSADVALAMDVIGDILQNSLFDPEEIELERGVILQEIGQSLDTPDDVIFDWLQEVAYPDQPMGRTILGPAERVHHFTREDLTTFVGEHYAPSNLILAAAGGIDHETIVEHATRLFENLPEQAPQNPMNATYAGGERREIKDLEQAHFALAIEAPGYRDEDIYKAQIHALTLGGGMSSRLFQEAREKRGLCYSIFAQAAAFSDSGLLTIYAGTSGDKVGELASVTINELRKLGTDLSQAELDRARAQMKAGMLMGLESPSARCERLARMTSIWNRIPSLEETVEKIDKVSLNEMRAYGEALCAKADPALALYGPTADAPEVDDLKGDLVG